MKKSTKKRLKALEIQMEAVKASQARVLETAAMNSRNFQEKLKSILMGPEKETELPMLTDEQAQAFIAQGSNGEPDMAVYDLDAERPDGQAADEEEAEDPYA